jgi:thiol:disulfide interchange protein
MTGKVAFFTFLLVACVAMFIRHQVSSRAPRLTDKGMIARQAEYQSALDESHRIGKPIVLDFYADWCGPCRWMQANTWNDPRVVRAMQNFVLVPVNVDQNRELSKMFGVEGIPYVVVISPDGKVMRSQTGAVPPDTLISWLPEVNRETTSAQ